MKNLSLRLRKDCTLLYEVTKANFKMQNEHSYLGIVWYLLGPALLFCILIFVFSYRLGTNIDHYPLYVLMGIIAWNFFATGAGRSMTVVVRNASLLKALPIRTEILVLSSIVQTAISHIAEVAFFFALLFWYGVIPEHVLLYGVVLMLSFGLTYATGLLLSVAYVFLRDVDQIWSVVSRAWWFATPIFYAPTQTGLGLKLSMFNPLYYIIHMQRELLIYGRIPPVEYFIILSCFTAGTLVLGMVLFRMFKVRFIEFI